MEATQNTNYTLPITGMDSEHCALIIDKGLENLKGVKTHKVDLNNRKAEIQLDKQTSVQEVVSTIRGLGYDVAAVKKTFPVTNLSCASCAVSVESILKSQAGVLDVAVNFASNSANVEFIPDIIGAQALKVAVQSVGYDLIIDEVEGKNLTEELHHQIYNDLKTKTIRASLLSLPVVAIGMFFMHIPYANWIMMLLSAPVVFWFGKSFFVNAFKQAKHKQANMDTLVALSTGIAFLFSAFNTIFNKCFSLASVILNELPIILISCK